MRAPYNLATVSFALKVLRANTSFPAIEWAIFDLFTYIPSCVAWTASSMSKSTLGNFACSLDGHWSIILRQRSLQKRTHPSAFVSISMMWAESFNTAKSPQKTSQLALELEQTGKWNTTNRARPIVDLGARLDKTVAPYSKLRSLRENSSIHLFSPLTKYSLPVLRPTSTCSCSSRILLQATAVENARSNIFKTISSVLDERHLTSRKKSIFFCSALALRDALPSLLL